MRLRGCLNRRGEINGNLERLFMGQQGLRAGWRVGLFLGLSVLQLAVVIAVMILIFRHAGAHRTSVPTVFTPWLVFLNELALLLPVCGATGAMAVLEDRSFLSYGLDGAHRTRRLAGGLLAGVAALGLLAGILLVTGYGVATPGPLGWAGNLGYGAAWAAVSLLVGFTEEFAFRGYVLRTLTQGVGFWPAAFCTSAVFGAMHGANHGETLIGLGQDGAAGLLFCLGLRLTKSLWWSIGFHGGWDYAENFIFGTHDSGSSCYGTLLNFAPRGNVYFSGGLTGPEGSVFAVGVLLLAAAAAWQVFAPHRTNAA